MRLSEQDVSLEEKSMMDQAINNPDTIDAMTHPFYGDFESKMRGIGIRDTDIVDLWKKLLKAYKLQGERVRRAQGDEQITTIEDYLNTINSNADLISWVDEVCSKCPDALTVPNDRKLALWTGGYKVSEEAQRLGFWTLEATKLGNVLNTLKVTTDWLQEEALWNILSKRFVEQYNTTVENGHNEVHIYFRNVDELCVLFQQEIPALKQKDPEISVIWHPLVNNGTKLSEVGYISNPKSFPLINIEATNKLFFCRSSQLDSFKLQYEALEKKVHAAEAENMVTLLKYRSEMNFHPDRAPFATDNEATEGRGVHDFLNKFWNQAPPQ